MTFEAFVALIVKMLQLDIRPEDIREGAGLYDDWALDSIQVLQLLIAIEAAAGVDVPPEEIPELWTASDAFSYYRVLLADNPARQ
jgi:acyl carrier protein